MISKVYVRLTRRCLDRFARGPRAFEQIAVTKVLTDTGQIMNMFSSMSMHCNHSKRLWLGVPAAIRGLGVGVRDR
jgi:hypothetical protein